MSVTKLTPKPVDPAKIPYGQSVMTPEGLVCSTAPAPTNERDPRRHQPPRLEPYRPRTVGSFSIETQAQEIILRWLEPTIGKASELGTQCDRLIEEIAARAPEESAKRADVLRHFAVGVGCDIAANPQDRASASLVGTAIGDLLSLRDQIFLLRDAYNEQIYELSSKAPRLGVMSDIRLKTRARLSFALARRLSWLLRLNDARSDYPTQYPLVEGITNMTHPGINGARSIHELCEYDRGTVMMILVREAWSLGIDRALGLSGGDDWTPPEAA